MFEKAEIGIPCPECGHKTKKTVAWIKANDKLACAGCGSAISIDAKKLVAGLDEANKSIAQFKKSLRGFGKRR